MAQFDQTLERLRSRPPWVKYRNQRIIVDDRTVLDQALAVAGQHTSSANTRRRFWELFTGGDALFAPEPLVIEE